MSSEISYINPEGLYNVSGISHMAVHDSVIYMSGLVPCDANGNVVGEGNLEEQTRQIFNNLNAALEAAGSSLEHITKLNYFICNISSSAFGAVKKVREEFLLPHALPASTIIGVTGLVSDKFLIEIEAYAVIPSKK